MEVSERRLMTYAIHQKQQPRHKKLILSASLKMRPISLSLGAQVSVEKVRRRGLALRSLEQGMFSSNKETNLEP